MVHTGMSFKQLLHPMANNIMNPGSALHLKQPALCTASLLFLLQAACNLLSGADCCSRCPLGGAEYGTQIC